MINVSVSEPQPTDFNGSRPRSPLAGTRLGTSRFLSEEEKRILDDAAASSQMVKANKDLVREGDAADSLHIVTQGWACRYTMTREGGRQLSALIVPGDIGNLDSLMLDRIDYSVRTLTDATIVAVPRGRLLTLIDAHAGISRAFTHLALLENAALGKWALSLGRRSAKERLAHLLCELSVRLNGETEGESEFECPCTQEQLADALGLTSVHINRTMQQLRSEGLLVKQGRTLSLPDVARLRQIGGFDPRYLHIDAPVQTRPCLGGAGA